MNEREMAALAALKSSKKYRDICPDTVERTFVEALPKMANLKQADKAAREKLHQISGAFMTAAQLKQVQSCLQSYMSGDEGALSRALSLHASTAERLPIIDRLYERTFERTGQPARILDLACGLNPLYLGARGLSVRGMDIHGGATELINQWARALNWDVAARCADLTLSPDLPDADLALLMKLLPVIEQQRKGAAMALLGSLPARRALVSFPTRTLGGRGVGMEANYTRWFEGNLPPHLGILDRFVFPNELCYITEVRDG